MAEVVDQGTGRTKWKRFGLVLAPAVAAGAALAVLVANGALAASFAVSGSQFKVSADSLNGTGFRQFGGVDQEGQSGQQHPVVVSVIDNATLTNLCQSVTVLGFTIRINAGGGATPVTAQNLVVDASQIQGNAEFGNIQIGRDAGTLGGPSGTFAQSADTIVINDLRQTAWATTAGTFKLPGLNLRFGSECF